MERLSIPFLSLHGSAQTIPQDHFNYPNSICRHAGSRAHELEQMQTNASIVMNLTEQSLWLCANNPCKGT